MEDTNFDALQGDKPERQPGVVDEIEFADDDTGLSDSKIIKVIGVGGSGSNAVNRMFEMQISGVDFIVCNTDKQALRESPIKYKIQLGKTLTEGLGAGNNPERGREAAIESLPEIEKVLDNKTKMVFITAGMGGGTGTGAAPIIAKAARDRDILTIGVVSIPFRVEGEIRIKQAMEGIKQMQEYVDSLLIINNEKLITLYPDMKMSQAFSKADEVLGIATRGISEIITEPLYVNIDFEDVKAVMRDSGVALMGIGRAGGENRDIEAIKMALNSPLLKDNDIKGAKNILLNIRSQQGEFEASMTEFTNITEYLKKTVNNEKLITDANYMSPTNVIFGSGLDDTLGEDISVTVIVTGFKSYPGLYDTTYTQRGLNHIPFMCSDDSKESEEEQSKELELDFDTGTQRADSQSVSGNYTYLGDIETINDTKFLERIEDEPAIMRKKPE